MTLALLLQLLLVTLTTVHVVTAQDAVPTIRITDSPATPTVSSPMAVVPTTNNNNNNMTTPTVVAVAPSAPSVVLPPAPTNIVPAPSVVIPPTPTGGEAPSIQLDIPTVSPTTTNIAVPTVASTKSPSSSNSTTTTTAPITAPIPAPAVPSSPVTTIRPTTFTPTITFSPTNTFFPTITANPTSAVCNICTTGSISSNDVLQFENGNVTCAEASESGRAGIISSTNCIIIQELLTETNLCTCIREIVPTASPTPLVNEPCNICGDGYIVSNIEGELLTLNVTDETLSCGFVNTGGIEGILTPEVCTYFANQTSPTLTSSNPCGCIEGDFNATTDLSVCYVCGNDTERVTLPDAVISLPKEVIEILPTKSNTSVYTCQFIEDNGRKNNSFDGLVCSFLQMLVADECGCQYVAMDTTPSPSAIMTPSSPILAPSSNNSTSSSFIRLYEASSFRFGIAIAILPWFSNFWA